MCIFLKYEHVLRTVPIEPIMKQTSTIFYKFVALQDWIVIIFGVSLRCIVVYTSFDKGLLSFFDATAQFHFPTYRERVLDTIMSILAYINVIIANTDIYTTASAND